MKLYRYRNTIILIMIAVVIGIMTLTCVWNQAIWGDEGYTILLVKRSFSEIIMGTSKDVHPPLYYIIAKIASNIFGYSITLFKSVSFIPILILFGIAITKIQKEFGFLTALSFIFLIGLSPSMVYHLEIRMYSWAMLFVTLCALFLYDIMKTNRTRSWWGLVISGLAAAYTHYYGLITVAFLFLSLFVIMIIRDRKNLKKCLLFSLVTIVGYLPWLFILLQQFKAVSENYWIAPISVRNLVEYVAFVIGREKSMWILIILLVVLTILYLFRGEKLRITNNKKLLVIICFIGFVGNIAAGIILSVLIKPIFYDRYIYVAIGLLWLAFSIGFSQKFEKQKLIYSTLLIILVVAGIANFKTFYEEEQYLANEIKKIEDFATENIKPEDIIVSNISQLTWTVLEVYFPENRIETFEEIDWEESHERVWLFSDTLGLKNIIEIENAGYEASYILDGRIEFYLFCLYLAER